MRGYTASRIESLTKHYGAQILLSKESLEAITPRKNPINGQSPVQDFNFRFMGKVQLKGKTEPVGIYECFDGEEQGIIEKKKESLSFFEEGMSLYYSRQFIDSKAAFEKVLAINPKDRTAGLFFKKANQLLAKKVSKDWTGVEVMTFK